MATIVFQAAGAVIGSALGPFGAVAGRALGAMAGSFVDSRLFGSAGASVQGQHLATARVGGVEEGVGIPRVYGTSRIGGTLIWATRFEEEVTEERAGGKASGTTASSFAYFGNFAFGICEGPVAAIRRVWADGRELDLSHVGMRFYRGDDEQLPDPLIEAKQGEGNAPAYRGLCYVVFERLPLDNFGNRIPVLQFEVLRPTGRLEKQVKAIAIIPGATEHGLCPYQVTESIGNGAQRIINRNTLTRETDWEASIDELMALCPNLERVALVVSWFGTDLRAGECRILPGVETAARNAESSPWQVNGITRENAHVVSLHEGGPAYGGTPNDAGLIAAIADLKARGLKVFLYPFLMMDVPEGNGLSDPYGASEQAAYPWRGRITCDPAPGLPGTTDRTAAARAEVERFVGTAQAGQFTQIAGGIDFDGPETGYRRMVLHYAHLAVAAGGLDGFIIGSELKGLTSIRDENDAFPFVEALTDLAHDVRRVLGPHTALTYGADWSEYFGYHPSDGSGDVYFNLDPLWASDAITAVGIDNYMPLSDWRDEDLGAGNPDGFRICDDPDGLESQIAGGEGYEWYYASDADRAARQRTPITDGSAGKPWVYRYKDIENWWANPHFNRVAGVEVGAPTAWLPKQKPVWFTELGCPAVDKGACQPNVFGDPKSSESAFPYFSSRRRADAEQRRFLETHLNWWENGKPPEGMLDPGYIFLWCWDIRPYPAFPRNAELWSDGRNWLTGHWLNGRLGATTLADTVATILRDHRFSDGDTTLLTGDLSGYLQADIETARNLLEPLLLLYSADCIERDGRLMFRSRLSASLPPREISIVADLDDKALWQETRQHDSDLAGETIVSYLDADHDYEQASARSARIVSVNDRILRYGLPASLPETQAMQLAGTLLRENRISARGITFDLSPQVKDLEVGDVIRLSDGPGGRFMVTKLEAGKTIAVEARSFSPLSGNAVLRNDRLMSGETAADGFAPRVVLMDLPHYTEGDASDFARIAVFAKPWRRLFVLSSATLEGYAADRFIERPASTSTLVSDLRPGATGRFDFSVCLEIDLDFGGLESAPKASVLAGVNRIAVEANSGVFEIIGFLNATEIARGRWRLEGLLRGLAGTEDAMNAHASAGSRAVILNDAVVSIGLNPRHAGLSRNYIVTTSYGDMASDAPYAFSGGLRAQTPLAPVHFRANRSENGDVAFTWIRRSRIDADDWSARDIPLDEDRERYRIEIFNGNTPIRQLETGEPNYLYSSEQQQADFGSLPDVLSVKLYQLGRKVPLGIPQSRQFFL
ncbi:baseplate multidomain protein megatron [Martelella mediterranea]|uniref:Putative tail protein n=1 Tax=Martelella mediterranea TaxID=293089 RepID=A0A4R3NTV8_9HYPH|nr:glycoside hydrolase/phage tail family protein [Martelella mediterranea]TCT40976.1 putative tail protein [Martelella mediterranea]